MASGVAVADGTEDATADSTQFLTISTQHLWSDHQLLHVRTEGDPGNCQTPSNTVDMLPHRSASPFDALGLGASSIRAIASEGGTLTIRARCAIATFTVATPG